VKKSRTRRGSGTVSLQRLRELSRKSVFALKKEEKTLLAVQYKVEHHVCVLNPSIIRQVGGGLRHFYLFIDHGRADVYHAIQEYLARPHSGLVGVYYTVSWSEIVIQFCGTTENVLQYVQALIAFVKNQTKKDLGGENVIECLEVDEALVVQEAEARVKPILREDALSTRSLLTAYGKPKMNKSRFDDLRAQNVILGYDVVRDFIKTGQTRTIVLISYNSVQVKEKDIFKGTVLNGLLVAYKVTRTSELSKYGTDEYENVHSLAVVETNSVAEFREWMDALYKNSPEVNCLTFIVGNRQRETPLTYAFESDLQNTIADMAQQPISLGRSIFNDGRSDDRVIGLRKSQLIEHTTIIGLPRTGKTSCVSRIVKMAAKNGIRSLLLDVKGDLEPPAFSEGNTTSGFLDANTVFSVNKWWGASLRQDVNIIRIHGGPDDFKLNVLKRVLDGIEDVAPELPNDERIAKNVRYLVVLEEMHKFFSYGLSAERLSSILKLCPSKGVGFIFISQALSDFSYVTKSLLSDTGNWIFFKLIPEETSIAASRIADRMKDRFQSYAVEAELGRLSTGKAFVICAPSASEYATVKLSVFA
jgi:hypothetical protein